MKQCANPECPSHLQNRRFPDQDVICPRCGEPLQIADEQVDPNLYQGSDPYGSFGVRVPKRSDNLYPTLGAIATLALVGLIIWALASSGRIGAGATGVAATATPVFSVAPAVLTERAIFAATRTAQPTAVGGSVGVIQGDGPTPGLITPLPTAQPIITQPAAGGNGSTIAILCRRIEAGQPCQQVSSYATSAGFYLAVQSDFLPNADHKVTVRWFGPPDGTLELTNDPQTSNPVRNGRYWLGFQLTQTLPWQTGVYRADIYLNNSTTRAAYATWEVVQ